MVAAATYLALTKNIVHAAYSFFIVLLNIAIFYLYLNAEFIAVSHLMVYIGGILIVIIFGVMLTKNYANADQNVGFFSLMAALMVCFTIAVLLIISVNRLAFPMVVNNTAISIQDIGYLLLTNYVLPFEASTVLLMIALMGAATIANQKTKDQS
jgi:NADH-quinone oxidoreductase subunit J